MGLAVDARIHGPSQAPRTGGLRVNERMMSVRDVRDRGLFWSLCPVQSGLTAARGAMREFRPIDRGVADADDNLLPGM